MYVLIMKKKTKKKKNNKDKTTQNISGINYFEKITKNIIVSIHTWF